MCVLPDEKNKSILIHIKKQKSFCGYSLLKAFKKIIHILVYMVICIKITIPIIILIV